MPRKRQTFTDALAERIGRHVTAVVDAYLREAFSQWAPPWSEAEAEAEAEPDLPPRARRAPSPAEAAAAVLGVAPDAPREVVDAAYRALAARAHPDRGGSAATFRAVTEARDALYRARRWKRGPTEA